MILRTDSLKSRSGAYKALGNVELRYVHTEVVLCVSDCAFKQFYEIFGRALGGVLEDTHSGRDILASDKIENDAYLARRNSDILEVCLSCFCFHFTIFLLLAKAV